MGATGLMVELFLLEHTESAVQWVPTATLAAALTGGAVVALRPDRATLMTFRALMALSVLVGVLGVYLHLRGNVEFELEADASVGGLELLWRSLKGATPALAPGAMVQLGLLGLIFAYRHPLDLPAPGIAGQPLGAGWKSDSSLTP